MTTAQPPGGNKLQALILAAGFGRRMRPLTYECHKALLHISGSPIIDRIIGGLEARNVSPITIATGYRSEDLITHIGERFPHLDVRYVNNSDYASTNNIHSMALALEAMDLDDDVILIESDLVYEPAILERLLSSTYENVALVDTYRSGMDGTVVTIGESGAITQVIPPALQSSDFSFTDKYKTLNIYRFSATFCKETLRRLLTYYTQTFDKESYYELILGILIYMQRAEIHAEIIRDETWAEVDDPNDLRIAEFKFSPQNRYDTLSSGWGGNWDVGVLDFAFIRNMYFPTPAMLSELRLNLPALLHNYGSRQSTLDEKMAWALEWPPPLVHAVAGTSQCYPWLRSRFRDKAVLIPDPTFGEYRRIFPEAATYRDAPGVDWREVERSAARADVVVFVNPNNPTGTTLATEQVVDLAKRSPTKTIIVDESFIDFCDEPSFVEQLQREPLQNVLVIKSLSKSLGVPGLRLGCLCTSGSGLSSLILDELPIWNLSSVAENFLEIMLKHRPALEESYARTTAIREEFSQLLRGCDLVESVFPSGGNFLLVRLTVDAGHADALARSLAEKQAILVKDASAKMADGAGYWRLAVRTTDENQLLVSALR